MFSSKEHRLLFVNHRIWNNLQDLSMTWFSAGVAGIRECRPETELLRRVSYLLSYASMLLLMRVAKEEEWRTMHTAEDGEVREWEGPITNYAGTTGIDQVGPRQTENMATLVVNSKAKNTMLTLSSNNSWHRRW